MRFAIAKVSALLAFILLLAAAGGIYQAAGMWQDRRHIAQRGCSFRVGSISMNLNCMGQGSPTVILESGMGGSSLDWIRVQPAIARFARVCSYDRAGYGWSDASGAPRTSLQIAKELKGLLDSAQEAGPYVLVGHSFGGYIIRVFTKLFPLAVTGMVLVDSEHPDEGRRLKELQQSFPLALRLSKERADKRREFWDRILSPVKLYLGLERLKVAVGGIYSPSFPADLQHEVLYLEQQAKYIRAVVEEDKLDGQSAAPVLAASELGDWPLIVLTAEHPYDGTDDQLSKEQMKQQDDLWISLQAQYMSLSSRSKQVVVLRSSHEIPADRPGAIVSAVHEVINQVR